MASKYQKLKEKLKKKTHGRYQNLSQEEDKRHKKVRERYKNLPPKKQNKSFVYKNILNS